MPLTINIVRLQAEFGLSEPQIRKAIEIGQLVPEGWQGMTELERAQRIQDKAIIFNVEQVHRFMRELAESYLQIYTLANQIGEMQYQLDKLTTIVERIESQFNATLEDMTLAELAAALGKSKQYLQNQITKYNKDKGPVSRLIVERYNLPCYKVGNKWLIPRHEYLRQKKGRFGIS